MLAALPELHLLDADAESAPEARQRNFALLELLLKLEELTRKDAARRDTAGLLRSLRVRRIGKNPSDGYAVHALS